MFEWYYFNQALAVVDKVPKEVTICATAYILITDIHKRITQTKIEEIKANKEVQTKTLEVERLRLELELQRTKHPIAPPKSV